MWLHAACLPLLVSRWMTPLSISRTRPRLLMLMRQAVLAPNYVRFSTCAFLRVPPKPAHVTSMCWRCPRRRRRWCRSPRRLAYPRRDVVLLGTSRQSGAVGLHTVNYRHTQGHMIALLPGVGSSCCSPVTGRRRPYFNPIRFPPLCFRKICLSAAAILLFPVY